MQVWVGTSGYSYTAWKGTFYPDKLPNKEMLSFYGSKLSGVEINSTFYRVPQESVLKNWAEAVPNGFRFALKASRGITHFKRLKGAEEATQHLIHTVSMLADRLGPILYQLPPNFKRDDERLSTFIDQLPNPENSAFEFRHASWFAAEVFSILRSHNCALCLAESDESEGMSIIETADWGYLRLRKTEYSGEELETWAERVKTSGWKHVYAFFKHEDTGAGTELASHFAELTTQ